MKQTRTFRRIMSFLLIVTMLVSVAVVGIAGVSAAEELALNYSYKYSNAGYAEGRIELTGSADDYGTYYLYWADDTKALDGYAEISAVNLNSSRKFVSLAEFTAIPAGATKIIAIKSTTEPADKTVASAAVVYDIPEDKQFGYSASDVEYNFQTLSDIHVHKTNYYTYAETHFKSALNAAADRGAEFVSTVGDQTNYGDETEWARYLKVIAESDFTGYIFEVTGNHEDYGKGTIPNAEHTKNLNRFITATGLGVETEKMPSELYYEITAPNGDHHIYMSLELVNNEFHPGISDNFTKAQIDWLEGLLNKYKNDGKKIFIYEHAPFARYGAGDNKVTPHYEAAMTIDKSLYPQTYRFKELLEANKDVVWFSGHTHIDFKYNYNIDNENGTSAYSVHVPSTASTTLVNASGGLDRPQDINSAQGYFVDVYADATVLNGTDLVKNEILPLYTYLVDYTGEEVVANPDFVELEDLYEKATVTVDVKALVGAPASVKVSLYGAEDEGATSVVEMTKNADGTYTAQVSKMYTKMKFVVNNGTVDIKSAEYPVEDSSIAIAVIKIKYNNDQNWSNVNIYAWSDLGGEVVTWPGMAMTKEADGTYTAIIPNYPNKVIFNDGTNQTDDLDIAPYIVGSTEPQPPVTVDYLYGDADRNGKVNVKDATTVGKYAADLIELDDIAFIQANVTGDKAVNVRDCTAIQKFVADLITSFAVEANKEVAQVSAASDDEGNLPVSSGDEDDTPDVPAIDVTGTLGVAQKALADEYYYASYVAYSNLKKAVFACKDEVTAETAEALDAALADYNAMKANNPTHIGALAGTITPPSTEKTKVYFVKPADWADAYIYVMDGSQAAFSGYAEFPGDKMTLVEGDKYSFEVPAGTGFIKFTDGSTENPVPRTENVSAADIVDGRTYSVDFSKPTSGKEKSWAVKWEGGTTPTPTPTPDPDGATIYFVKPADWAGAYIHLMDDAQAPLEGTEYPGTKMTLVEGDKYSLVLPEGIGYIKFTDGTATDPNKRTENVPATDIVDGRVYTIGNSTGTNKWAVIWEGAPAPTPTPEGKTTVYFINSAKWAEVAAYSWNDGETPAWPGTLMTKTADTVNGFDVYSMTFETAPKYIIFNNNNNNSQTEDLSYADVANKYYYFKDKTAYGSLADVPAVAPPSTESATVYFIKPADWADAYIYLMDDSQAATGTAYPGDKMNLVEGDKYSFEVPAGTAYIKFTDGTATDPNMRTENTGVVGDKIYEVDFDKPTSGKANSWATK